VPARTGGADAVDLTPVAIRCHRCQPNHWPACVSLHSFARRGCAGAGLLRWHRCH